MSTLHEELERLERATSRREIAPAELDAETAQLREAWVALGQLLAAAAPSAQPVVGWAVPPAPRSGHWSRTTAIALAASLVLGVGATWMCPITGPGGANWVATHAGMRAVQGVGATEGDSPIFGARKLGQSPATTAENTAAWDDALDTQLAQAGEAVAQVSQDWNAAESPFAVIQFELEQTRNDVMNSPL